MKKIGLIFDVDGTLWDSSLEVAASWDEIAFKETGRHITKEDLVATMGLPMTAIADRLFPELKKEDRIDLLNRCTAYELIFLLKHPGKLYEEEEKTLKALKEEGFHLAILSNAQPGYIEVLLSSTGLGYLFDDHICWGDNLLPKSKNMEILKTRNKWDEVLYIGDTSMDEEESDKAGVKFIHASYGFGKASHPFLTLKTFEDLLSLKSLLQKEESLL